MHYIKLMWLEQPSFQGATSWQAPSFVIPECSFTIAILYIKLCKMSSVSDGKTFRNKLSYNFFLSVYKSDVKWMQVLSCSGDKSNLLSSLLQTTIENGWVEAQVLCCGIYGDVLPAAQNRNPHHKRY
jgi:hypothetical protein